MDTPLGTAPQRNAGKAVGAGTVHGRPRLIAHADWSIDPGKRWLAPAVRQSDGVYRVRAPAPVGTLADLLPRLAQDAGDGRVLLGVDFPIGLPEAYAALAGVDDFVAELPRFGTGRWARFYDVATMPEEVSRTRPFYPQRAGGRRRQHLVNGLGVSWYEALLRQCERRTGGRPQACSLFWTLGGNQVGKGAIAGWCGLLGPALRAGLPLAIWPFGGRLEELLALHAWVVAETYPREAYDRLGLDLRGGGKRSQPVRARNAERLLATASALDLALDPALRTAIITGFGARADGEDRFDAVVGLLGLLGVVCGARALWEPDEPIVRSVEGWIIGQAGPGLQRPVGAQPGMNLANLRQIRDGDDADRFRPAPGRLSRKVP